MPPSVHVRRLRACPVPTRRLTRPREKVGWAVQCRTSMPRPCTWVCVESTQVVQRALRRLARPREKVCVGPSSAHFVRPRGLRGSAQSRTARLRDPPLSSPRHVSVSSRSQSVGDVAGGAARLSPRHARRSVAAPCTGSIGSDGASRARERVAWASPSHARSVSDCASPASCVHARGLRGAGTGPCESARSIGERRCVPASHAREKVAWAEGVIELSHARSVRFDGASPSRRAREKVAWVEGVEPSHARSVSDWCARPPMHARRLRG